MFIFSYGTFLVETMEHVNVLSAQDGRHRIQESGTVPLVFTEFQSDAYLSEDHAAPILDDGSRAGTEDGVFQGKIDWHP